MTGAHTHTHTREHANTHTPAQMRARAYTSERVCSARAHARTRARTHARTHTHTHTHTHTRTVAARPRLARGCGHRGAPRRGRRSRCASQSRPAGGRRWGRECGGWETPLFMFPAGVSQPGRARAGPGREASSVARRSGLLRGALRCCVRCCGEHSSVAGSTPLLRGALLGCVFAGRSVCGCVGAAGRKECRGTSPRAAMRGVSLGVSFRFFSAFWGFLSVSF